MKFLIVDDSSTICNVLRKHLNNLGHKDTLIARDGVEALELLEEGKVDILFTDFNMPNLNGLELTRVIREDQQKTSEEIKIILLKGDHSSDNDVMSFEATGIDGRLSKPFNQDSIKAVLDSLEEV